MGFGEWVGRAGSERHAERTAWVEERSDRESDASLTHYILAPQAGSRVARPPKGASPGLWHEVTREVNDEGSR